MIQPINKDTLILSKKSTTATPNDAQVGQDLVETLQANKEVCVGMAANMIGVNKQIIVVQIGMISLLMYNPTIVSKSQPYSTEEGCLSLSGERKTTRFEKIEVSYLDSNFQPQKQSFQGFVAQIIQHEIDHCNGIII